MVKIEREQELLNLLREKDQLSVRQLAQKLFTSESTVRRMLAAMEHRGLVRRTYGGAELTENYAQVAIFSDRTRINAPAKQQIAQKACAIIPDGSIIFLDQSSTAYYLAEALRSKKGLTVVTNNIQIAVALSQTDFTIHISGGQLSQEMRMCLVGEDASRFFEKVYADFAFFSARSLSDDGLISDCDRQEICVRDAMLKNAKKTVFLCDSSKFGGRSGYRQCSLSDVDMLISELDRAQQFSEQFPSLEIL